MKNPTDPEMEKVLEKDPEMQKVLNEFQKRKEQDY